MAEKTISPYRKRLNTEIITKTELALEAIKRHDMEQSRMNFYKNLKFEELNLLKDLDNDFSYITPSKKVDMEKTYSVNLFAHSHEFYSLSVVNHAFPMRILIKNVRNEGVLYVGYDREYPGIERPHVKQSCQISATEAPQIQKNYNYKASINKETLISLKNKENKEVAYIYFTFTSGSSFFTFNFKVESFGIERDIRLLSEVKLKNSRKKVNKSSQKDGMPTLTRQNTEPIQIFRDFSKSSSKFPALVKHNEKAIKIQDFQVFTEQIPKHFSKSTLLPQKNLKVIQKLENESLFKQTKLGSQGPFKPKKLFQSSRLQKSDFTLKLEETKRNKHLIEICKNKDRQMRQTANKCKVLIENYQVKLRLFQKTYNQEIIRKRKLNKNIVIILYSLLYVNKIHQDCSIKSKKLSAQTKIISICKRFITSLKKKHQQVCAILPYRSKRMNVEGITSIGLQSKLIQKYSIIKAETIAKETLFKLMPMLGINKALNSANVYRNKLKLIQRTWRSKYHSRIYCLLFFIDNHVEKMVKQYPHLKIFLDQFYKSGANRQLTLNYIKDESEKYRYIYDAYLRKLQQIQQIIEVNKKILLQKSPKKSKINVSKRPTKPMHRFYRNCDILKSMIRTWFQIQYKKYCKKNFFKYTK